MIKRHVFAAARDLYTGATIYAARARDSAEEDLALEEEDVAIELLLFCRTEAPR